MPYLFNTPQDQAAMLAAIGAKSIDELFELIPADLRFQGPLKIPPALSELELTQHVSGLAANNQSAAQLPCFLGGGSYDHFIPAAVDHLAGRAEFYTSYTPYQPEVSQGNLQVMFEYQTLICQLTGMDVSNASLYDGGSAAIEAVMMCLSVTGRHGKVVSLGSVHPEYRRILETYLINLNCRLETVPTPRGAADLAAVANAVDKETACILVQHPNFFGCIEDVEALAKIAHDAGALLVVSFDPISLGLLKRPGDLGADVVVAEGQSLGSPMAYGGPYLGIIACREPFVRRMPGRIAGQTVDRLGRRCWVLTLQTREQHIRREKATSNICTNQGLFALRASIYLSLVGPQGLREVAQVCLRKSHFAAERIAAEQGFSLAFQQPFFKEFVVRASGKNIERLIADALAGGVMAGVPLGSWYPELDDCFLVTVTEKRTRAEIERLTMSLAAAARTNSNNYSGAPNPPHGKRERESVRT